MTRSNNGGDSRFLSLIGGRARLRTLERDKLPRIPKHWSRSMRPRSSRKIQSLSDITISMNSGGGSRKLEAVGYTLSRVHIYIYSLDQPHLLSQCSSYLENLTTSKLEKAINGREGVSRGFHRGFEWCSACRANQERARNYQSSGFRGNLGWVGRERKEG